MLPDGTRAASSRTTSSRVGGCFGVGGCGWARLDGESSLQPARLSARAAPRTRMGRRIVVSLPGSA
jgi:hypothetical protein